MPKRTRPLALPLLAVLSWGLLNASTFAEGETPMFRFTERQEKTADVTIDAGRVSDFAVPPEYFGKFTEVDMSGDYIIITVCNSYKWLGRVQIFLRDSRTAQ